MATDCETIHAPLSPSGVIIVPNESRLVLGAIDHVPSRVLRARSGRRQLLSLGSAGRRPLDTG